MKAADFQDQSIGNDITWEAVPLYAWSSSEVFLNIVCGSIPVLKPLWDLLVKGKPMHIIKHFGNNSGQSVEQPKFTRTSFLRNSQGGRSSLQSSLLRFGKRNSNTAAPPAPVRAPVELEEGGTGIHRSYITRSVSLESFILHDR